MTDGLPSLAGADWLATRSVRAIFATVGVDGDEVRVIGGAVRNAFLGRAVGEIDFATTAMPDVVTRRAAAAGMKVVPTGIEHGTVTVVADGTGYQVTTLREDVETDGRHAVVRFGRDWVADAQRRDFTVNALSVDAAGAIADPVGGYADILAGRIRFIGDPGRRIAEDRLRILRLFRFHAEYGKGDLDRSALSAAIHARHGLRELSAERIGEEMRRLAVAPRAAEIAALMQDAGILPIVLGGVGYVQPFARAIRAETAAGAVPAGATRLASLACAIDEDVARLTLRLRLSNEERDRMLATLAAARAFVPFPDERTARGILYRVRERAFRDGVFHAFARSVSPPGDAWKNLYHLPDRWTAPVFPLGGRDVLRGGAGAGPAVGAMLRTLEAWWIANDFAADEASLRSRLQQMIAAGQ